MKFAGCARVFEYTRAQLCLSVYQRLPSCGAAALFGSHLLLVLLAPACYDAAMRVRVHKELAEKSEQWSADEWAELWRRLARLRRPASRWLLLRRWAGFALLLAVFALLHYVNYRFVGLRELYLHVLAIPVLLAAYALILSRRHMLYVRSWHLSIFCALCGFTGSFVGAFVAEDVLAVTQDRALSGVVLARTREYDGDRWHTALQVQYRDEQGKAKLLPQPRIILPDRFCKGDTIPLYALSVRIPEEEEGAYLTDGAVLMAGWQNMAYALIWPLIPAAIGYFIMAFSPPHIRRQRMEAAAQARRARERRGMKGQRG